jgi:tetratricopeptide (TPR) repeat protein
MNPTQPPLPDLLARYLARQASAHEDGLGLADLGEEVVPFDAVPVQPIEPRLAWTEAIAVLRALGMAGDIRIGPVPPEWSALVATHEPEIALPFCLGNFPQMVRHLPALLHNPDLSAPRVAGARAVPVPGLEEWAEGVARSKDRPQAMLAAAVLRLARQFDAASRILGELKDVPASWQDALANERASLAWHRGNAAEAIAIWRAQTESVPVHFNRGMAAMFLGEPAEARTALARAAAGLPEDGAWHHLARLYLALAEMRG